MSKANVCCDCRLQIENFFRIETCRSFGRTSGKRDFFVFLGNLTMDRVVFVLWTVGLVQVMQLGFGRTEIVVSTNSSRTNDTSAVHYEPFTIDGQRLKVAFGNNRVLLGLLQEILVYWNIALAQSAHVTNLGIKTATLTPLGNGVSEVMYNISGEIDSAVIISDATARFQSRLAKVPIEGVALLNDTTIKKDAQEAVAIKKIGNQAVPVKKIADPVILDEAKKALDNASSVERRALNAELKPAANVNTTKQEAKAGNGLLRANDQSQLKDDGQFEVRVNGSLVGIADADVDRSGDKAGNEFQFTDDLLIQYTSDDQRNKYLQNHVLGFWKEATGVRDVEKIKLVYLSSKPFPDAGPDFQNVIYRVTGSSNRPLNKRFVINAYYGAVLTSGFSYMALPQVMIGIPGDDGKRKALLSFLKGNKV